MANEVSIRLQKELDEANQRLSKVEDGKTPATRKKAPMLGSIGKNSSTDGVSKYNQELAFSIIIFSSRKKFHGNHSLEEALKMTLPNYFEISRILLKERLILESNLNLQKKR